MNDAHRVDIAKRLMMLRRWSEEQLQLNNCIIRWDVLLSIGSRDNASIPYAELASEVGRSPRALNYVIRDLQELGWVATERATHDRRCAIVSLTGAGKLVFNEMVGLVEGMFASPEPRVSPPSEGSWRTSARGSRSMLQEESI